MLMEHLTIHCYVNLKLLNDNDKSHAYKIGAFAIV
jgi:hypothetical protein